MNATFNTFAGQPLPHSRGTLAMVVVAHFAAALLIVQMFEARRYVEPMPLMVSLLPAPHQAVVEPFEPLQVPETVREVKAEPEPIPEPPHPVKFEPQPPPPQPAPEQKFPEPAPDKFVEPTTKPPAPDPPPRAITEVPATPTSPISEPVVAAVPEPQPVTVPQPAPVLVPIPVPPPEPLPVAVAEPASQLVAIEPVPVQAAQPPSDVTITQEMLAAIYLRNPKPGYPNLSRRLREQGTVLLRVFVTVAGDPIKVELKSSSGFSRLDRAAHDAVQRWKFVPAKRGEQAVDAWVIVPIKFSLKG